MIVENITTDELAQSVRGEVVAHVRQNKSAWDANGTDCGGVNDGFVDAQPAARRDDGAGPQARP